MERSVFLLVLLGSSCLTSIQGESPIQENASSPIHPDCSRCTCVGGSNLQDDEECGSASASGDGGQASAREWCRQGDKMIRVYGDCERAPVPTRGGVTARPTPATQARPTTTQEETRARPTATPATPARPTTARPTAARPTRKTAPPNRVTKPTKGPVTTTHRTAPPSSVTSGSGSGMSGQTNRHGGDNINDAEEKPNAQASTNVGLLVGVIAGCVVGSILIGVLAALVVIKLSAKYQGAYSTGEDSSTGSAEVFL